MSGKQKMAAAMLAAAILVGTAVALSNINLTLGTTPSYDFGVNFGGAQPATIQLHTFTLKAGETIPWHYHKAVSYVVLERGVLTETHVDEGSGGCVSEQVSAGSAFVEGPGQVHTVTNTGDGAAVIAWATVFPTSDGMLQISPQFTVGGIYPVPAPNCD